MLADGIRSSISNMVGPGMSGFGRKAPARSARGSAADLAAKRAALLAEERRGRVRSLARAPARPDHARYSPYIREKSIGPAYVLWFFFGGVGAPLYLGFQISAALKPR